MEQSSGDVSVNEEPAVVDSVRMSPEEPRRARGPEPIPFNPSEKLPFDPLALTGKWYERDGGETAHQSTHYFSRDIGSRNLEVCEEHKRAVHLH